MFDKLVKFRVNAKLMDKILLQCLLLLILLYQSGCNMRFSCAFFETFHYFQGWLQDGSKWRETKRVRGISFFSHINIAISIAGKEMRGEARHYFHQYKFNLTHTFSHEHEHSQPALKFVKETINDGNNHKSHSLQLHWHLCCMTLTKAFQVYAQSKCESFHPPYFILTDEKKITLTTNSRVVSPENLQAFIWSGIYIYYAFLVCSLPLSVCMCVIWETISTRKQIITTSSSNKRKKIADKILHFPSSSMNYIQTCFTSYHFIT